MLKSCLFNGFNLVLLGMYIKQKKYCFCLDVNNSLKYIYKKLSALSLIVESQK